jgi:dienelactone hydrolase
MERSKKFGYLLIGFILLVSLTACSQRAITSSPDIEYQDVSLSLDTVNPEEHLHLFEYDRSQPLDIQVVRSWRRFNVTVTELTFASPRGERVPTLLFEPDGDGPFAGLVLMHGAPGTKENFKDWGVYYARYGFVAIAIDAPQFRSDHNIGHVSMAILWPRFDEKDLEEQSQLILDLQRAVDLLLSRENVDPERLAYIGGSYGGAMGGLFAGVERRLKAYVLKVGDGGIIEHLSEPDEQGYPKTLPRWVNILWPIEPLHYVGLAAPAELLFLNGVTDSYVPASDSLRYQQAGSDPKTIIWYNEGHFLPRRHYFDLLTWLHQRIGAGTILMKPYFSASGLIYDRLLVLWFILSVISLLYVAWDLGIRSRAGWGAALSWTLVILFLGPVGPVAYTVIKRRQIDQASPTSAIRALSASLWIVMVTMIGVVAVQQINFVTVFSWQVRGLFYYFVPQITAFAFLLLRLQFDKRKGEGVTRPTSYFLGYLFASTLVTICAFLFLDFFGELTLHIAFPIYNLLWWFVIMLTSILILIAIYLPHLWLGKLGLTLWVMPPMQPKPSLEEQSVFQWYKALGLVLGSYLVLFLLQAYTVATFTPIYITFSDAVKMMVGLE